MKDTRAFHSSINSTISQHSHHKTGQILDNDGLFAGKRQKQQIIERLKKGTLFRLSSHFKPTQKTAQIDPYLNWLRQNSVIDLKETSSQHTMGETFFYLRTSDFQKQKKLKKTLLPKLSSLHQNKKIAFSLNKFQRPNKSSSFNEKSGRFHNQSKKQKTLGKGSQQAHTSMNASYINSQHSKHDKKRCFQNKLSMSQLFQNDGKNNISHYSDKQNLIKSNFYLNDHKKYPYAQTFYIRPKKITQQDHDLKRVKGLNKTGFKSFQQNLTKLQKKANQSCYNELSSYFSNMRNDLQWFIQKQKKCLRLSEVPQRDSQLKVQREMNRMKTSNIDQEDRSYSTIAGHLPQFLVKVISSPIKNEKSPLKILNKVLEMQRIRA